MNDFREYSNLDRVQGKPRPQPTEAQMRAYWAEHGPVKPAERKTRTAKPPAKKKAKAAIKRVRKSQGIAGALLATALFVLLVLGILWVSRL